MILGNLAALLPELLQQVGDQSIVIEGITSDSRAAGPGMLFVAVNGPTRDGHDFIADAHARGATAFMVQDVTRLPEGMPALVVPNSAQALAFGATILKDYPARKMNLVGLTGTNGKTSTSYILEKILQNAGKSTLVVGTVEIRIGDWVAPSALTTPGAVEMQSILAQAVERGATHGVLEVSSHGLQQYRADGIDFDVAAFTNLSQDHLDYHASMDAYFEAKARLFEELLARSQKGFRHAVIGADDKKRAKALLKIMPRDVEVTTFGMDMAHDIYPMTWSSSLEGLSAELSSPYGPISIQSPLVGQHNLLNIMCAAGIALAQGLSTAEIEGGIAACASIPGRLESLRLPGKPVTVLVDYAHTPEALAQVVSVVAKVKGDGKLTTLFGCGGDRDKGKRPLMAQAVAEASDRVILTTDNPRFEAPEAIIEGAYAGIRGHVHEGKFSREISRERAIAQAILSAEAGDVVLITGKGHEDYQDIAGVKHPFNDAEQARAALARWGDE